MVLYADDTGIVITVSNKLDFNININQMFQAINTWFNVSLLTVNFSKTQYLELRTTNYCNVDTEINYGQKFITNATEIKFLGLIIDDSLSWKQHIERVASKMCTARYPLRNIKYIVPLDTLRIICCIVMPARTVLLFYPNHSY